jgi:hypothetical protein
VTRERPDRNLLHMSVRSLASFPTFEPPELHVSRSLDLQRKIDWTSRAHRACMRAATYGTSEPQVATALAGMVRGGLWW